MGDKIATVGNKEMPLVTFALFTYNQESFVQEAIEAAFSQTYEPLEIILSDDCSSDRTYEIMQEMTDEYRGPHSVIVRQTEKNIGTLLHVKDVANIFHGSLLVLAAGDDVSKPERVKIMAKEWLLTGAWGLYSKFDRIDENSVVLSRGERIEALTLPDYRLRKYFYGRQGEVDIVHGATSAYDKRLFEYLHLCSNDYILAEDGTLSVLLNLLGKKVVGIEESLVLYREHMESLTNSFPLCRLSFSAIKGAEKSVERLARSQENRCNLFLRLDQELTDIKIRNLNLDEVVKDRDLQRMLARIRSSSFLERLKYLLSNMNLITATYILPRLFGLNLFFIAKFILNLVPSFVKSK